MSVSCPISEVAAVSIISSARANAWLKRAHLGKPGLPQFFYGARGFAQAGSIRVPKLSTLVPILLYISARLPRFAGSVQVLQCPWVTAEQNSNQLLPPRKMKWLA
jgi:hypothetical protein